MKRTRRRHSAPIWLINNNNNEIRYNLSFLRTHTPIRWRLGATNTKQMNSSLRVQSSSRKNHSHERDGMWVVRTQDKWVFHAEIQLSRTLSLLRSTSWSTIVSHARHTQSFFGRFCLQRKFFLRVLLLFRSANRLITCVCVCVICVIYDSNKCLIEIEEGQLSHRIRPFHNFSIRQCTRHNQPCRSLTDLVFEHSKHNEIEWTNRIDKERAHFTRMNW